MRYKKFSVLIVGLVVSGFTSLLIASECTPTARNRPVCPAGAAPAEATFIDPTAVIADAEEVRIGPHSYIAPFAGLHTDGDIHIGEKTNLQDSVILNGNGKVTLGDEVILAHGARVTGPAKIGRAAVAGEHNAAFVGFNSLVDKATVEHDAMVLHLARVAPGITIKHGKVVLSGKNVTTQAQADDPALGKVIPISDALRVFMEGVLHVNETFAREYTRMYQEDRSTVTGINYDPGNSDFNPTRDLPTLAGTPTQDRRHRNRIIGDITLADNRATLNDTRIVGNQISLRTDEGEPFHAGHIKRMKDRTTFHALEHTGIEVHDQVSYGFRSLVHGGASAATVGNAHSATVIGNHSAMDDYAVVFRSVVGEDVKIGCASLIDGSTLPDGTVVPPRTVVINQGHAGATTYPVEWNPGCRFGDDG